MATFIKGNAVANATSYELLEKTAEGEYNSLEEKGEINFEVSAMGLMEGDHTLVVKAKADGYEDSDYSNELVYTVDPAPGEWEVYSQGTTPATVEVVDGVPTATVEANKAVVMKYRTNDDFSFVAPRGSAADGGRMIIVGEYGTNVVAIRPRGAGTGTMLQRYDYATFGGGALKTDANAVNTFAAGDTLSVKWSGTNVSLYVNGELQSTFDCSAQVASETWKKHAGWLETNAGSGTITLGNFKVGV